MHLGATRAAGAAVECLNGDGISVDGVQMVFETAQGPLEALHGVSLQVPPQRFVSMIGPSGCGKSSLLMLAAGLERPTAGRVVVGGEAVTKPYPGLGIVFQRDLLLGWRSVLDNVLLQVELLGLKRSDYKQHAQDLLRMVGLEDFERSLPRQLSGGMRQRVSICRALVHRPKILLMDEPFGALDALTREQLNVDVGRLCLEAGVTTLFVTHSIDEAIFLADEVVILSPRPGKVVARMPVDLPRPRTLAMKATERFGRYVAAVRETFEKEGVLHDYA